MKSFICLLIFLLMIVQGTMAQNQRFQSDKKQYNLPWPSWIFGHWVWEDEGTSQSAMQLVDDYLDNDIEVSAIIIDSPWETGYNNFEWDQSLYPNPQAMVNYFHSKDVRVMMWITTMINTDVQPLYDYAKTQNYFLKSSASAANPAVVSWWKGQGSALDVFNPAAVQWWQGLMDSVLNLGIDGWKCDGAEYNTYFGGATWSPYKNSTTSRLDYSHAYYRLFFNYTRQKLGNDRVITARPVDNYGYDIGIPSLVSFAPVDINFCGWVGDQDATFSGLKAALNNMYHSSQMGYLAFGSDIGGYREDNNFPQGRSKELFIRWAQLGAFSPIMENGGGGEHRPWMFDTETTEIYRKLVEKRYQMIDYLMENSEIRFNEGRSLMEFTDKATYRYTLGPDIFVAPFLQGGTSITVSFPAGDRWIYLYDISQVYEGGTQVTLQVPQTEYPVFIREGSNPFTTGVKEETAANQFRLFPNPNNGKFRIDLSNISEDKYTIEVIDLTGQNVFRSDYYNTSNSVSVDLSGIKKGFYILKVSGKTEPLFVKKLVVQ